MSGRAQRLSLLVAALPLLLGIDLLQSRDKAVEEGNAQMKAGKPEQALGHYDDAVKRLPQDPSAHFNRGAALYGLSRWEEAAQSFLEATEAKPPELKASAFYNLGNAFFQGKKFGEAVEAFKKSLAYNPGDKRAKWNLELALRSKKEEDKKQESKDDKNKKDDPNQKGEEKQSDEQDKDKQAKNDPNKPGEEPQKSDKDGKGGEQDKDKQDEQAKQEQKDPKGQEKPDQKPQQAKEDPKQKPDDKSGQGKPQQDKQDQKQASKQPQQGQTGNKGKTPDMAEVEAILDNLEKSPKALEQELARMRAMHRRPPAKDW